MSAVIPLHRPEGMLGKLLSPLHVLRVAPEDHPHTRGLLRPPQAVVRLKAGRQLLERLVRTPVHPDGDDVGVVSDADRLRVLGIRAPVRTGPAGFPASVDRPVFPFPVLEQLPAHRAGHPAILMPDEAAQHAALLKLYRYRRALIAGREDARMQALLNILRFRGLPGCFVDFRGNVFQIVNSLILVVLKANIGNCAVHQALLYVFPAFIPLVRNEFRRLDFKFLFGLLRHPAQQALIRIGHRRLKRGNDVIFLVHHRLDVVGGQQSRLGTKRPALRIGLKYLILSGFLHAPLVALVFPDPLPDLPELFRHVLFADIQLQDSHVPLFFLVRLIHLLKIFLDPALLLPQIVEFLLQNLRRKGFLLAVAGANLRAVHSKRALSKQLQLRASLHKILEDRLDRLAVVLAEIRNRPEIGPQHVQQIKQLHISPAFRHEPPGGADTVQIAVDVELQHIARVIAGTARSRGHGAHKAQIFHEQTVYIRTDHPHGVVFFHQLVDAVGQKPRLLRCNALDIAHALTAFSLLYHILFPLYTAQHGDIQIPQPLWEPTGFHVFSDGLTTQETPVSRKKRDLPGFFYALESVSPNAFRAHTVVLRL